MRRQALEQEVERIGPPIDPDIAAAEALLDEFAGFWEIEAEPGERRKLLGKLFDRVWQDGGTIVAVRPSAPFGRYFVTVREIREIGEDIPETPTGVPGCHSRERRGQTHDLHLGSRFGSERTTASRSGSEAFQDVSKSRLLAVPCAQH